MIAERTGVVESCLQVQRAVVVRKAVVVFLRGGVFRSLLVAETAFVDHEPDVAVDDLLEIAVE